MEGRSAVWLLAALLLMEALISAEAQNSLKYFEVEGKMVLQPEPVSDPITSISWEFDGSIVGEWYKDTQPLLIAPAFRGRANVNTTTGELEISNMMISDTGVYTVAINDRVQSAGHDIRVITLVPEPNAVPRPLTCSHSSKSCLLSCDGDVKEAGPVTFYFKMGDGGWEEGNQTIEIINDATTKAVKTFSCRMKNPFGEKDSEPVKNPFYEKDNTGLIVGIVVVVIALVGAAVGGGVWYQKKQKSRNITDRTRPSTKENGDQGTPLNES